jgi:hypothetical protein
MLTIDECKKHIGNLNLPDDEVEKIRELLYAFVERTLDYGLENGMFVVAEQPWEQNALKEILNQQPR